MLKRLFHRLFSFWIDMDEDRRRAYTRLAGLAMLVLAIFCLVAVTSYLFTWKEDQSVLQCLAAGDRSAAPETANAAGTLGLKWAFFLVTRCFGLGAYAVVLLFGILGLKMLSIKQFSLLRGVVLTVCGALLASYVLAMASVSFGLENAMRGGLGGEAGAGVVHWCNEVVGPILTWIILLLLAVVWFFFASRKFSSWLSAARPRHLADADEETQAEEPVRRRRKTFTFGPSRTEQAEQETATEIQEETVENGPVAATEDADGAADASQALSMTNPEASAAQDASEAGTGEASVAASGAADASQALSMTNTEASEAEAAQEAEKPIEIISGEPLSTEGEELPPIDVKSELSDFRNPPLSLLEDYEDKRRQVSNEELMNNNYRIRATLKTFGIEVDNVKAVVGPTVTLYKVYPAPGVKTASIRQRNEDIAMSLHAEGVRIVNLNDSVGVEVANKTPSIVPLKAMLNDESFRDTKYELPIALGYTITQKVKVFDLADSPHLLVAGATKQGKSVGLNVIISSLLYAKHPSQLKFVFIDPKMVEFTAYSRLLKHYLAVLPTAGCEEEEKSNAVVKSAAQAAKVLKSLCIEMDDRYKLLSDAMVAKVTDYNDKYKSRRLNPSNGHRFLPYLVVVIDEYADLTMSAGAGGDEKKMAREISTSIIRLAQKGRAAGIHVVIATQRPSVDIITGAIKANFPTRIAFRTLSGTDSKTILDTTGAEKLIGNGDLLYYAGVKTERVQCAYISMSEINEITRFIEDQKGYKKSFNVPYYLPEPEPEGGESGGLVDMKDLDERFEEAARLVVTRQKGSTSDLQRQLGMGYAKAGRVMDQLEAAGIVGPQEGAKPRQVLVSNFNELEAILKAYLPH